MSTKGLTLAPETRYKISLAKTKHTKGNLIEAGQKYLDHLYNNQKELPTLTGYCLEIGCHPDTLPELAVKYKEVGRLVGHIQLLQEQYCLTNGITNKANPIFAMFLLKSKHLYKDQPQKLEQNNYLNISADLLADAMQLLADRKK